MPSGSCRRRSKDTAQLATLRSRKRRQLCTLGRLALLLRLWLLTQSFRSGPFSSAGSTDLTRLRAWPPARPPQAAFPRSGEQAWLGADGHLPRMLVPGHGHGYTGSSQRVQLRCGGLGGKATCGASRVKGTRWVPRGWGCCPSQWESRAHTFLHAAQSRHTIFRRHVPCEHVAMWQRDVPAWEQQAFPGALSPSLQAGSRRFWFHHGLSKRSVTAPLHTGRGLGGSKEPRLPSPSSCEQSPHVGSLALKPKGKGTRPARSRNEGPRVPCGPPHPDTKAVRPVSASRAEDNEDSTKLVAVAVALGSTADFHTSLCCLFRSLPGQRG